MKLPRFEMSDRHLWQFCGIAFLTGIFLRFKNLYSDSLWLDEISTYGISQTRLSRINRLREFDFNPPFYDYLQKIVLHVFPVHDEFSIRFLSVCLGIAALAAVFFVFKKLLGLNAAALAMAFVSTSATQVHYSREARPYSLMFLTSVLSIYFTSEILKEKTDFKKVAGYILSVMALCYSHYGGLIFSMCLCLGVQIYSLTKKRNRISVVAAHFLIFAGYYPWLQTTIDHSHHIPMWLGPPTLSFFEDLSHFFYFMFSYFSFDFGYQDYDLQAFIVLTFVFCLFCIYRKKIQSLKKFFTLAFLFFIPFVFVYGWLAWISPREMSPRHLMAAFARLLMASVFAITELITKRAVIAVLCLTLFTAQLLNLSTYYQVPHKSQLREAAAFLAEQANIGTVPILSISYSSAATDFYLQRYNLTSFHLTNPVNPDAEAEIWNSVKNQKKIFILSGYLEESEPVLKLASENYDISLIKNLYQIKIYELDRKHE
jgi:uncharacterized membrane protein